MPELPEVETISKQLTKEILDAIVVMIEVRESHCFEGLPWTRQEKIVAVERIGKYIFIKFESGRGLQIHLKMTGRLILEQKRKNIEYREAPHTRVVINLADGRTIYYWDIRMFGYVKHVIDIEVELKKIKDKLGQEPWKISDIDMLCKLQKTGRAIKEAILDQSLLAGVGNIYANDGLWLAGIDPQRKANSLKLSEVKKLRASLMSVLERGLVMGGASDNTYRDFYGGRGGYQNEFLVYGRTSEPCNKCGKELKRVVVGGRGTWMCEKCQK